MLNIDDNLVQQRLVPAIEALEQDMELLEPEEVISIFNEFGLFIVNAEAAMD